MLVAPAAWAWPDLQVVKTGPALAARGDLLTYTLKYTNAGPQKSTSVVLKDFLPNYITVQTNTLSNGSLSGSTVTWSIGTVSSGVGGSRSFQVRVNTNAFAGLSLTNRAQITGSEAEETGKTNNNYSMLITRITNRPPVALNDFYVLTVNMTLAIPAPGILANDSDPDGTSLTAALVSGPAHGSLTFNPNGSFSYQPVADYVGADSFTYRANDGQTNSGVATVTLSVEPCHPSVDVMLVIDRSGSMLGAPYNNARLACSNFVHNLKLTSVTTNTDLAGLASYNSSATLDQKLTNRVSALEQAIAGIPAANGNTSITLGLQTAQAELLSARHNPQALPVILLLSDGLPTGSDTKSNALYAATQAKNAGTRVFTVGLGAADGALMAGIATSPSDYFYTTNSAQLTALFNAISTILCRPPTNILGPVSLTLCPGATANFNVSATGCDSFTYQWLKNGTALAGQTASTLTRANVSSGDAGTYSVIVSSACLTRTNSATLTVNSNVSAAGPFNQTNCIGGNVLFGTTASGTGPITYQWFKNGVILTNQTTASLALNTISAGNAGNYSVVIIGACGAPITNTASLTVSPLPAITGPANQTVQFGAPWTFGTPTANYPITIVSTATNLGCGNTLIATRTWRVTDPCGNIAQASQTVTVIDTTAPVITCAANKSVQCGATWTFDAPTTSDGTVSVLSTTTNLLCGETFSATRTWKATDACGNVAQCSQTVTVVDTTAPTINCVANKTVEAGAAWTFDAPTASDGCGTNTITILSTVTNTTGACGNTFSATRTWRATDACGNTAQCSQTVTVRDTTAPTLTCVANKTVECGAAWNFDAPTATDIGGTNTISVLNTVTNAVCGNTFSATRTWKATDACGNGSQCSQTVTVVDTTAPTIACSANKTVEVGAAWTFDTPTATDGCGTNTVTILSTVTNTTGACGNTFSATRTWRATDACGNTAQCSQTVTVRDTTAPTLTCVANKTVQCGSAWTFDAPSATDVGGTNTITILSTVTNALCGQTFSATRTWRATDACGNASQCSQTVTVLDTTAPTITCVANKTVEAGAAWTFNAPTASDGCGTVTIQELGTVTNVACGNTFSATRTWRATDSCGNTAECSQTVTVLDTTVPTVSITSPTNGAVFIAPANFTVLANAQDVNGMIAKVEFFEGTNKLGEATNGAPYFAGTNGVPAGNYTLTARATDACGNMSTSAPVSILVIERPPLTLLTSVYLNPQTEFFEQRVRITNPTYSTLNAVRVLVYNLTNTPAITVYNSSGFTNGVPYVQTHAVVPPGSFVNMTIEFHSPLRIAPNPVLQAELVPPAPGGGAALLGTAQHINRGLLLANKTFLVEFATMSNRIYAIQYSSDLMNWKAAQPAITGTGNWVQWIDNGEPKTESAPATQPARFYRLVLLP